MACIYPFVELYGKSLHDQAENCPLRKRLNRKINIKMPNNKHEHMFRP